MKTLAAFLLGILLGAAAMAYRPALQVVEIDRNLFVVDGNKIYALIAPEGFVEIYPKRAAPVSAD
jgi:hypothetical protein